MSEADIQDAIRLALGAEPDVVLWRNNTGLADHGPRGRVRYGLAQGSADLVGILAPRGRWLALEVKADRGRVTPEQRAFLTLVRSHGGFAAIVRSVDDAREAIARARNGESE